MSESLISPVALCEDADGNLVPYDHEGAKVVFCGAGSTLDGDRAAKLQAHLAASAEPVSGTDAQPVPPLGADKGTQKFSDSLLGDVPAADQPAPADSKK